MAIFPGAISSFTGFTSGHTLLADGHASQHNSEQAEIVAVQTKVGTGASTSSNNTVLRGNGTGTSTWGQVALTTDVTGVLPVANGGLGQGSLTGVPLVSPTITGTVAGSASYTTPAIASFVNATHTHQNAAGGGQLLLAALTSTFLSTQVTTYTNPGTAGGTNTFFYINIGGIKYLWGITADNVYTAVSAGLTLTLPVGFFTTIQHASATSINQTGDTRQTANVTSATTITVTLVAFGSNAGSVSTSFAVLVIGT